VQCGYSILRTSTSLLFSASISPARYTVVQEGLPSLNYMPTVHVEAVKYAVQGDAVQQVLLSN
jgi:hypothetical protein